MNIVKKDSDRYFVFNGRNSLEFGIHIYSPQILNTPKKKREIIEVSGRNGDIIIEDGSYENVEITFKDCFIIEYFAENFKAFKDFVCSQKGYKRLEVSWLPDEYRMAMFDGNITPVIKDFDGFGKFDLVFICKPQRFLKSGEIPVEIPCEPATSPASARRYWRLSQFGEYVQEDLSTELQNIGYTTAEINAMQFSIMPLDLIGLPLENIVKTTEIKGVDDDRAFLALTLLDPTYSGQGDYRFSFYPYPNLALNQGYLVEYSRYAITKKSFGLEVWFGDKKIAQDETYQFGTVVNPTRFDAIPKFRVQLPSNLDNMTGATTYLVGAGQNGIAVKWTAGMESLAGSTITLDTETMDAYILAEDIYWNSDEKNFVNLNSNVKFYGNRVVLTSGENTIRLDPMVAGCEIVPRWWTI